jgi:hypothetical protein
MESVSRALVKVRTLSDSLPPPQVEAQRLLCMSNVG